MSVIMNIEQYVGNCCFVRPPQELAVFCREALIAQCLAVSAGYYITTLYWSQCYERQCGQSKGAGMGSLWLAPCLCQHSTTGSSAVQNHRIMERLGLEWALKIFCFQHIWIWLSSAMQHKFLGMWLALTSSFWSAFNSFHPKLVTPNFGSRCKTLSAALVWSAGTAGQHLPPWPQYHYALLLHCTVGQSGASLCGVLLHHWLLSRVN